MSGQPALEAPPRRKRSCIATLTRVAFFLAILLLLALAAGAFAAYLAYDYVTRPGQAGPPIRVDIPEGATGQAVGRILAEKDLIDHELFFRAAMRLDSARAPIKHGVYDLPTGLSPTELLHRLQEGPDVIVSKFKLTVPEGLSLRQMATLFDDPEAFDAAARDPELIRSLGIAAPTLEGFLMPDTYFFDERPEEAEVVERMVGHFRKTYETLTNEIPQPATGDLAELVTVASLVEEESRIDEERPLVAAVIYNRLQRNMPLDLDSTLQYALNKYGQRLLDRDKDVDSPYNTYKNAGLPPGPISNPGVAALRAAMQPADGEYLYFVSNADGMTHTFSSTLSEHNRAVARFRRNIAEQRRQLKEQAANAQEAEQNEERPENSP